MELSSKVRRLRFKCCGLWPTGVFCKDRESNTFWVLNLLCRVCDLRFAVKCFEVYFLSRACGSKHKAEFMQPRGGI